MRHYIVKRITIPMLLTLTATVNARTLTCTVPQPNTNEPPLQYERTLNVAVETWYNSGQIESNPTTNKTQNITWDTGEPLTTAIPWEPHHRTRIEVINNYTCTAEVLYSYKIPNTSSRIITSGPKCQWRPQTANVWPYTVYTIGTANVTTLKWKFYNESTARFTSGTTYQWSTDISNFPKNATVANGTLTANSTSRYIMEHDPDEDALRPNNRFDAVVPINASSTIKCTLGPPILTATAEPKIINVSVPQGTSQKQRVTVRLAVDDTPASSWELQYTRTDPNPEIADVSLYDVTYANTINPGETRTYESDAVFDVEVKGKQTGTSQTQLTFIASTP